MLVVSIVGPQSSGKSTLLNYIFGCSLASLTGKFILSFARYIQFLKL